MEALSNRPKISLTKALNVPAKIVSCVKKIIYIGQTIFNFFLKFYKPAQPLYEKDIKEKDVKELKKAFDGSDLDAPEKISILKGKLDSFVKDIFPEDKPVKPPFGHLSLEEQSKKKVSLFADFSAQNIISILELAPNEELTPEQTIRLSIFNQTLASIADKEEFAAYFPLTRPSLQALFIESTLPAPLLKRKISAILEKSNSEVFLNNPQALPEVVHTEASFVERIQRSLLIDFTKASENILGKLTTKWMDTLLDNTFKDATFLLENAQEEAFLRKEVANNPGELEYMPSTWAKWFHARFEEKKPLVCSQTKEDVSAFLEKELNFLFAPLLEKTFLEQKIDQVILETKEEGYKNFLNQLKKEESHALLKDIMESTVKALSSSIADSILALQSQEVSSPFLSNVLVNPLHRKLQTVHARMFFDNRIENYLHNEHPQDGELINFTLFLEELEKHQKEQSLPSLSPTQKKELVEQITKEYTHYAMALSSSVGKKETASHWQTFCDTDTPLYPEIKEDPLYPSAFKMFSALAESTPLATLPLFGLAKKPIAEMATKKSLNILGFLRKSNAFVIDSLGLLFENSEKKEESLNKDVVFKNINSLFKEITRESLLKEDPQGQIAAFFPQWPEELFASRIDLIEKNSFTLVDLALGGIQELSKEIASGAKE